MNTTEKAALWFGVLIGAHATILLLWLGDHLQ